MTVSSMSYSGRLVRALGLVYSPQNRSSEKPKSASEKQPKRKSAKRLTHAVSGKSTRRKGKRRGMPPLSRDPADLNADRRSLVGFVLETYKRQGGRVTLPLGVDTEEDWLVDSLDIDRLLQALRKEPRIDLVQFTVPCNKRGSVEALPFNNSSDTTATSFHHHANSLDSAWEHATAGNEPEQPELNLPELQIDFQDDELQEIGFMLFDLCCAKPKDGKLVDAVRRQLELSSSRAQDISRVIKPFKKSWGPFALGKSLSGSDSRVNSGTLSSGVSSLTGTEPSTPLVGSNVSSARNSLVGSESSKLPRPSDILDDDCNNSNGLTNLQLIVNLLKTVRPSDFRTFKDYARWRGAATHMLVENLKYSAVTSWVGKAEQSEESEARSLIARLKGAVRRLNVPDAEDFDEKEYVEAADALESVAGELAKRTQGGWQFSWGLRVKLWETLLRSIFDSLEDGMYVEERDKILKRLRKYLAPRLGISPLVDQACYAWVHFDQFAKCQSEEMMHRTQELLEELKGLDSEHAKEPELDRVYVEEVGRVVVGWVERTLMNYHAHLPEAENMSGLLGLLTASAHSEDCKQSLVVECISSSCMRVFDKAVSGLNETEDAGKLKKLAECVKELFETELLQYTGHLASYCPAAATIAACQFHQCYGKELLPVLHKLDSLPEQSVSMICTADELEASLLEHITDDEAGNNNIKPWNVIHSIRPVLMRWTSQRIEQLTSWAGRLMDGEDWEPVSKKNNISRSAVELKKLFTESATTMFKLDLPFPKEVVVTLAKFFNDEMENFGERVVKGLGGESGWEMLVPALPALTRYKRDLAEQAEKHEDPQSARKSRTFTGLLKEKMSEPVIVPVVPPIEQSVSYKWIETLSFHKLMVMINSLQFLADGVIELQNLLENMWEDRRSESGEESSSSTTIADALCTGDNTLKRCMFSCTQFLAHKVIFWDVRKEWLEDLYRHNVQGARIDVLLDHLNKTLARVMVLSVDSARDKITEALMESAVKCYERVLLDGGPFRLFLPTDVQQLEEDVETMKELFIGGGEGIKQDRVTDAFGQVSKMLALMGLDTTLLIADVESALKAGKGGDTGDLADNADVLRKILGHRKERPASKWLKKHYSVPKRLK